MRLSKHSLASFVRRESCSVGDTRLASGQQDVLEQEQQRRQQLTNGVSTNDLIEERILVDSLSAANRLALYFRFSGLSYLVFPVSAMLVLYNIKTKDSRSPTLVIQTRCLVRIKVIGI